jgi:hypothetical protein
MKLLQKHGILLVVYLLLLVTPSWAQDKTVGVITHTDDVYEGYTLFSPQFTEFVYLIDNDGRIVHSWDVEGVTAVREARLLENGNLIMVARPRDAIDDSLIPGSYLSDGSLREYTWDGELVWKYQFLDAEKHQHHGFKLMPNGNVLVILFDYVPIEDAVAMGLSSELVETLFTDNQFILPDIIWEIDRSTNEVVWEWRAWDHLVQDIDPDLPNFGDVSENFQRIDINYHGSYLKGSNGYGLNLFSDWLHTNTVSYNPELDQIIISVHSFDEFWVIDHSISTEEATGAAGDLLYRWGNPFAYGVGDLEDRQLFMQHDIQWIEPGLQGEGNWLVFNNRNDYGGDEYSTVLELNSPLKPDGTYDWDAEAEVVWSYSADGFYSRIVSSAQRLPNGNTFITEGFHGRFIEVTPDGEVVWEYINPTTLNGITVQGELPNPEGIPGTQRNTIFRGRKYSVDFPGFEGRDMIPGERLVE